MKYNIEETNRKNSKLLILSKIINALNLLFHEITIVLFITLLNERLTE